MHTTTGQWKVGFALALVATVLWGALPIALKLLLGQLDPYTITWARFLAAAVLLGAYQLRRRALPRLARLGRHEWRLLAVAVLGLAANYALFIVGLGFITPGAAQMLIQLSPMLLLLGGLALFGERFGPGQWIGFGALGVGLVLFFNDRLEELFGAFGDYSLGVVLVLISAVTWTAYALAQKQLLKALASENIMLLIYVGGVMLFWPLAEPTTVATLDGWGWALLGFASLNTVFAYGAFAEALDHWEASRVSAVIAVTPLLTLAFMAGIGPIGEALTPEPLNALSVLGAVLVVGGSILAALSGRRRLSPGSVRAGVE